MLSKNVIHLQDFSGVNVKNRQLEKDAPAKSSAIFNCHFNTSSQDYLDYFLHSCNLCKIVSQNLKFFFKGNVRSGVGKLGRFRGGYRGG